tara:strand:+ start:139 stop:420 length:282 start_codon:yes stop_codon:yes gene_type:complete
MKSKNTKHKRKIPKRQGKKDKLFYKYSKGKEYLLKYEIILLMKKEFYLKYNNHVMISFMNLWGTKRKNELVITNKIFHKLFTKPDGFFRDIKI